MRGIPVQVSLPVYSVVQPTVVRYLEQKFVDRFFETGELRIPTCLRFWRNEHAELGDEHEALARVSARFADGGSFQGTVSCATDALVLSTSCVEDLREGATFSKSNDAAIRIIDTVGFASEVAKVLPQYRGGFQSFCLYRDSRLVEIDEPIPVNGNWPDFNSMQAQSAAAAIQQYIGEHVTLDALLRKGLRHRHQNEYRFIWFSSCVAAEDYVCVTAPDARKFCQRVTSTPNHPDLTVDVMGAKVTIATRFDPTDFDDTSNRV